MEQTTQTPVAQEKMDRRVRRTRKLLQSGLLELMKEKPIRSISMRELCRFVDICRTTPYLHYKDVLDILEQMEQALWQEMEALVVAFPPNEAAEDPAPALFAFYAAVQNNRQLFDVLLNYEGDPPFFCKLQSLGETYIRQYIALQTPSAAKQGYAVPFLLGALTALVRRYIIEGCRDTPEALVAMTPRLRP